MITPISLESDIQVTKKQLDLARKVRAEKFHIDIIDGLFADNLTIAPADLQEADLSGLKIDLHLLVDDPTEWLPECVALKPARIFAQIEKMGNIEGFVDTLKAYGTIQVGLGIGIHTPITNLSDEILKSIDGVLLMAIEPGFGGSPFHPEVIGKIKELRAKWDGWIVIDGGMNPATYKQVMAAGASEAGANSALWASGDFESNYRKFEE